MTGRVRSFLGRGVEWLWRGRELRELRQVSVSPTEAQLFKEAQSCLLVAWRILAGLEPVASNLRTTVAAPLLLSAAGACLKIVAPTYNNFGELCDDAQWQQRFNAAGLSNEQQAGVKSWLLEPSRGPHDLPRAKLVLQAVRAALSTLHAAERSARYLLWRRIWLFGALFVTLVGGGATIASLLLTHPKDYAAGKPWHASSAYVGYGTDGLKPEHPVDGMFFSTNEELEPWWRVDLQGMHKLTGVEVTNRTDCCPDRAQPLVVEVSTDGEKWREVVRQNDSFSKWAPVFGPIKARYVRVRSLRRTYLHLKDVKVFAESKP